MLHYNHGDLSIALHYSAKGAKCLRRLVGNGVLLVLRCCIHLFLEKKFANSKAETDRCMFIEHEAHETLQFERDYFITTMTRCTAVICCYVEIFLQVPQQIIAKLKIRQWTLMKQQHN